MPTYPADVTTDPSVTDGEKTRREYCVANLTQLRTINRDTGHQVRIIRQKVTDRDELEYALYTAK